MKQRLSMIALGVADLATAGDFYKSLGWHEADTGTEGAMVVFKMGTGTLLALYPWEALAEDANLPASPPQPFRGTTLAHNVGSPDEVDAVMNTAAEAGAKILKPADKTFWGGYGGYFSDPDGHVWEVAHNPFWFDAAGQLTIE